MSGVIRTEFITAAYYSVKVSFKFVLNTLLEATMTVETDDDNFPNIDYSACNIFNGPPRKKRRM